jgi:hypothetical protein
VQHADSVYLRDSEFHESIENLTCQNAATLDWPVHLKGQNLLQGLLGTTPDYSRLGTVGIAGIVGAVGTIKPWWGTTREHWARLAATGKY